MKTYVVEWDALARNIRCLQDRTSSAIYGVIKGNGYGLGLLRMAEILREQGVTRFAVTEVDDVRALREAGFQSEEILMMRATCLTDELKELLSLHAVATVGSAECARVMDSVAAECGKKFACHIAIDTGMGRYGFLPDEKEQIAAVYSLPNLSVCGIYTHFHSAFYEDNSTQTQFRAFMSVCDDLKARGLEPGVRHCCNSSAFLKYPEMHLDAVRIGSALLGRVSHAAPASEPKNFGLTRIGWCSAQVELVRTIPAGHTVGYGAGWKAKRETKIAVCGVGYDHGFGAEHADDLFRFLDCVRCGLSWAKAYLKHKAYYVQVNGKPARVLGHIGMVQTIFDVTDIPCQIGDPVRIEINPLMLKGLTIEER